MPSSSAGKDGFDERGGHALKRWGELTGASEGRTPQSGRDARRDAGSCAVVASSRGTKSPFHSPPYQLDPTTISSLSLHALWAESPAILTDTLHRSAGAPFVIAITTGYLLGDAVLVAFSTLPPALQRRLCCGREYGPISAPASTLAHHLVGQSVGLSCSKGGRVADVHLINVISHRSLRRPVVRAVAVLPGRLCPFRHVRGHRGLHTAHQRALAHARGWVGAWVGGWIGRERLSRLTNYHPPPSPPSAHMRATAGWQGSRAYALNGAAMVLVFFLSRVAALPFQVRDAQPVQNKAQCLLTHTHTHTHAHLFLFRP